MKTFELSQKQTKSGKRKFKAILHEIYPDACVDQSNQVGTLYNDNGITWIKEYCEQALETIKGMSLRCEFLDDERTELCGHGMTDIIDNRPIFENATMIGTFDKGYIEEIESTEGQKILACIGEGTIDASCYNNFCIKLDEILEQGINPSGSIEITKTEDNQGIVYKYGYVDYGRIPTVFEYSGYALLGVTPSDKQAKLIELNERKEELNTMNEAEIKALVETTISTYIDHVSEVNECKKECEDKVAEMNTTVEQVVAEKNEIMANSEVIQAALDEVKAEYAALNEKYDALWQERNELEKALAEAKAKERIAELNKALSVYSEEEQSYAKEEIEAFKADPVASEINSVVNKVLIGIGKKAKEANVVAEKNSLENVEDIFSAVGTTSIEIEDTNIF